MNQYVLLLVLAGFASFAMAWMPAFTKRTGISYAIVYVLAGMLLYAILPGWLPVPLPQQHNTIAVHLTELVVIVSLMGTGIKIDRTFSIKNWVSPIRLILVAMLLCIGGVAFMGHELLGFDWPSALLLGAALAPTDPVLASDVQVGPPNEKLRSETKFTLTAEAGMNDGMAFPFTWLAILMATAVAGKPLSVGGWLGYDLVYRILAGVIIGGLAGRLIGHFVFTITPNILKTQISDGFIALSMTLMVYGLTEMVHGYGFVAVFVSAIAFRHSEKRHAFHEEIHLFIDQAERILIAIVLLLFGGALVNGILNALTWPMVGFSLLFLLLLRPLAALLSLLGLDIHRKEKLAISFFGIRGLGTLYYLSFAFQEASFTYRDELWSAAAFTIVISVLMHGVTATPIMRYLKREIPGEGIPE